MCLARDSGNVESLLRVEARPFIAASLREIFNQAPTKFHSVELFLAQLFNARCCSRRAPSDERRSCMQAMLLSKSWAPCITKLGPFQAPLC